jgi:hypothetical protein
VTGLEPPRWDGWCVPSGNERRHPWLGYGQRQHNSFHLPTAGLVLPGGLPLLHLVSHCACGSPRSFPVKRPRPGYQGPTVKGRGWQGRSYRGGPPTCVVDQGSGRGAPRGGTL